MTIDKTFPEVHKHGDIREVFNNIYFVTGPVVMSGPLPMRFSRNMTIMKEDDGFY